MDNLTILALIKSLQDQVAAVRKLQGEKGDKGEKGDRGEQGVRGEKGERGLHGKDGLDGRDGKDGKDGKDGVDGVGIQDVSEDAVGDLTVTLTDGSSYTVALPRAASGASQSTVVYSGGSGGGGTSPKDVFVSPTRPSASTDQYLWIETGLGDGSDFTVWFNDPRI